MDGLRKVPDNVPNKELMARRLGKPLTQVPDPFGKYESFAHHNNARLREFLDAFGFDYEFLSATECYKAGRFDKTLLTVLERYDAVMAIMLPSLREERQQSYSPFLPVHPKTGIVMQVPIDERKLDAGTIVWRDPDTGERFETPVTGGHAKLQWKPDWAMRWVALGVDYEMAGKDLIDSVKLSGQIAKALGGLPPEGFNYELFLDEKGQKISKSKGNGLTIDEWLTYGTPDSLSLFMYQQAARGEEALFRRDPAPGRRLPDLPREVSGAGREGAPDEPGLAPACGRAAGSRSWSHRPAATSPARRSPSRCCSTSWRWRIRKSPAVLWGFIRRYAPGVSPRNASASRLPREAAPCRYFRGFREAAEDLSSRRTRSKPHP